MIIGRRSIQLVKLTQDYIELVRQKRNLPEIQNVMEFREYITPEMQQKWFESINNINNLYFLIETNNTFIGLGSANDIDWEQKIVNNGGIFIWDKIYLDSPEVIQASVLLTDLGFFLGIKMNYIRILKDNKKAIDFNRSLGYTLLPGQDNVYNQKYALTADIYFKATEKIRQQQHLKDKIKIYLSPREYSDYTKIVALDTQHKDNVIFEIT